MSLRPDPSNPNALNYSFSQRVIGALTLAGEAARKGRADAKPEHLLLGLLRLGEGTALSILNVLEVNPGEILTRVERSIGGNDPEGAEPEDVCYTAEAKRVLEFALAEARGLDSTYVGTEHLLLALLRQEDTLARQVLDSVGVRHEDVRAEAMRIWLVRVAQEPTAEDSTGSES